MQTLSYPDYTLDFRFMFADFAGWNDTRIVKTDNPEIEFRIIQNGLNYYVGIFHLREQGDVIIGIMNLKKRLAPGLGNQVYEPHSYLAQDYRRKGYMSSLYSWVLDNGFTLLSCGRQTFDSENLWKHLSNSFQFGYYDTTWNEILTCEMNQMMLECSNVCAFLRKQEVINGTTNQVSSELACEA